MGIGAQGFAYPAWSPLAAVTPISKIEMCIILALLSGAVLRSQRDDGNKRALKNFKTIRYFGSGTNNSIIFNTVSFLSLPHPFPMKLFFLEKRKREEVAEPAYWEINKYPSQDLGRAGLPGP